MSFTFYSTKNYSFFLVATLLVAAIVSVAEAASIPAKIQQRPNIIVIQPDDHLFLEEWNPPARLEYSTTPPSSMGTMEEMPPEYISPVPNINRLRNNGLEMTNAYAASTMCGTSRYSTLTGRLPSRSAYGREQDWGMNWYDSDIYLREVIIPRTKLQDVWGVEDGNDCTSNNLAAVLKQNGYSTGVVGKWHLENSDNERGGLYDNYPRVQDKVRNCGFDFAEAIYRENLGAQYNVDGGRVTHNMEHLTSEAIRFIQDSVGSNDGDKKTRKKEEREIVSDNSDSSPFFLYFNPTVPHDSGDVTDALSSGNCRETVQGRLPEEPYVPYGMTAGGNLTCLEYRQSVLDRATASAASMETRLDNDKMAGAVWVDDAIGSLFETLEALEILDNTLILFQLDHGLVAKGSVFEGGSRIVQFIHYPDQIQVARDEGVSVEEQPGWKFDGLVSTIDIAPTLMDLAGVPLTPSEDNEVVKHGVPRYHMDGRSWFSEMLAVNTGEDEVSPVRQERQIKPVQDNYFQDRCLFVEEGLDRAVRCGCYKYIYINDPSTGFTVREAEYRGIDLNVHNFYNLCDKDSGNYITSPESSPELWSTNDEGEITEELQTKLRAKMECLMKQTNPSDAYPDYETDCSLPLHHDKDESSILENETSSLGKPENIVIEADNKEPPKRSPDDGSSSDPGLNKPPSIDVTEDSESADAGTADVPYFRSPTITSKSTATTDSVSKSGLAIMILLLILAPCVLYRIYREVCRRFVVGTESDRYRLKAQQIENDMIESANMTGRNRHLEVGSMTIQNLGEQTNPSIESDLLSNYQPSFWRKLAEEMQRQAALRDKWKAYQVSGVVIGTRSVSAGTDTSSDTSTEASEHGDVSVFEDDIGVGEINRNAGTEGVEGSDRNLLPAEERSASVSNTEGSSVEFEEV